MSQVLLSPTPCVSNVRDLQVDSCVARQVSDPAFLDYSFCEGVPLAGYVDIPSLTSLRRDFTFEEGDVLLVSYPKSGNHWAKGFLPLVLNNEREMRLEQMWINIESPNFMDDLKNIPPGKRRIFQTHLPYHLLPEDAKTNKKLKIIFLTRHPKATVNSLFWFIRDFHNISLSEKKIFVGGFNPFFLRWCEGSLVSGDWFQFHADHWKNLVESKSRSESVHVICFENLKSNFVEEMVELGRFFGCPRNKKFYQNVQRTTALDNMRSWTLKQEEEGHLFWPMHRLFRRGSNSDWKNIMTQEQSDIVDNLCHRRLADLKDFPYKIAANETIKDGDADDVKR